MKNLLIISIISLVILGCGSYKTKEETLSAKQIQFFDIIGEWRLSDTVVIDTATWALSYILILKSDSTLEYYQAGNSGNGGFWTTGVSGIWHLSNDTIFFQQLNADKNTEAWRIKMMQDTLVSFSNVIGNFDSYSRKSSDIIDYKWIKIK